MTPVESAKQFSKASLARLLYMQDALLRINREGVEGDVVECGVWRGGHIILARLVSPQRVCWLYDTFTGMTAPGPEDVKRSGNKPPPDKALSKKWTMASLEEVQNNLKFHDVFDETKLRFIEGDVCETLKWRRNVPDKIALLRLDTDWYESTKMELEVLWPKLVSGGELIIDDWGHWMGARKAARDYLSIVDPGFEKRLYEIDYTAVGMTKL